MTSIQGLPPLPKSLSGLLTFTGRQDTGNINLSGLSSKVAGSDPFNPPVKPTSECLSPPVKLTTDRYSPKSGLERFSPPTKPNTERYSPPVKPNTERYSPPVKPATERYSPPVKPNTERYSPPVKPNTERYSPPVKPNTERFSPPVKPATESYSPSARTEIRCSDQSDPTRSHYGIGYGASAFEPYYANGSIQGYTPRSSPRSHSASPRTQSGGGGSGGSGSGGGGTVNKPHSPRASPPVPGSITGNNPRLSPAHAPPRQRRPSNLDSQLAVLRREMVRFNIMHFIFFPSCIVHCFC